MAFDFETLLAPAEGPVDVGENLEYDPAFAALERALVGKPEQQIGSTIVPAEPPDWVRVEALATESLARSKDLRLAVPLASALAARQGFQGLASGTKLVRGLVERYWPALHPQLDSDDPTDATMRVTALTGLCEPRLLSVLRGAPLAVSRQVGPITWRNIARDGGAPLDAASVDGAFAESGQEALIALVQAIRGTLTDLDAIEGAFSAVRPAPDLGPVRQFLREVLGALEPRLPREELPVEEGGTSEGGRIAGGRRALPGELSSRDDVLRAIDAICKYYATHEPSSPLPLLLGRCKRLVSMSFIEIVKEMVPDALGQVTLIAGKTEE
jgi:type VI secretion system protein ImpA